MMLQILRRFRRDNRGVQAIEFAIVAPIFIILILGVVEVGRYILVQQKVSKTAYAINDIVSQFAEPTREDVEDVFVLAQDTMHPFALTGENTLDGIIISATNNVPPPPDNGDLPPGRAITWQVASGNAAASKIGAEGSPPDFTGVTGSGFDLEEEEGAFVVEVSYTYNTIFAPNQFMTAFTGNPLKLEHNSIIRYRRGGNIPLLATADGAPEPAP